MDLPEYITSEEVQRVCGELGIRDWTALDTPAATREESAVIRSALGGEALEITAEEFRDGLDVELEHGTRFGDANVTNNHPLLTGKIVLAHLKEMLDYYVRLELAELEGDLFKAHVAGDPEAMAGVYPRVLAARGQLAQSESRRAAHA